MIKINGVTYTGAEAEKRSIQMLREVLEPENNMQPREQLPPQREPQECDNECWGWHDASKEKPQQGEEVILLLENGEQHAGHWLEHANKCQRNTRRWKIYKWNKYVGEKEVIAWRKL